MKKTTMHVVLRAIALLAIGLLAASDADGVRARRRQKRPAPQPAGLSPGLPYFQPGHRLTGVGLDRSAISDLVLKAREMQLIEYSTFSIMRDPRAILWARRITSPLFQEYFSAAGRLAGFPRELLEAQAFVESGGDPLARSPSGPLGIMQISAATGRRMGLAIPRAGTRKAARRKGKGAKNPGLRLSPAVAGDERLNPAKAIMAAARYQAALAERYGSAEFALWAYHSGEGAVEKILAQAHKDGIRSATAAKILFGCSPVYRRNLFSLISGDMDRDFGSTYAFCIKRAVQLLELYRRSPEAYEDLARQFQNPVSGNMPAPSRLWTWCRPLLAPALQPAAFTQAARDFPVSFFASPAQVSFALRGFNASRAGVQRLLFPQNPQALAGALAYVSFETRRLWEAGKPKREKFMPIPAAALAGYVPKADAAESGETDNFAVAADISLAALPAWEKTCLLFVLQDMGWEEYISYMPVPKEGRIANFGVSPRHADFFIAVYREAQAYLRRQK